MYRREAGEDGTAAPVSYFGGGWFPSGGNFHSLTLHIGQLAEDDVPLAQDVLARVLDAIGPELGLVYAPEIE